MCALKMTHVHCTHLKILSDCLFAAAAASNTDGAGHDAAYRDREANGEFETSMEGGKSNAGMVSAISMEGA